MFILPFVSVMKDSVNKYVIKSLVIIGFNAIWYTFCCVVLLAILIGAIVAFSLNYWSFYNISMSMWDIEANWWPFEGSWQCPFGPSNITFTFQWTYDHQEAKYVAIVIAMNILCFVLSLRFMWISIAWLVINIIWFNLAAQIGRCIFSVFQCWKYNSQIPLNSIHGTRGIS